MSRQTQIVILVALLAALAVVAYYNYRTPAAIPGVTIGTDRYDPIPIEAVRPQVERLKRLCEGNVSAGHRRDPFSAAAEPASDMVANKGKPEKPPEPVGPPPIIIPAKFFGYVADLRSGLRRAFFSSNDGENVYIVGEGETFLSRFRLLRINNATVDVEEIGSGRRTTVTLEEPGPLA